MKGAHFQFDKFIPDAEDVDAQHAAARRFFDLLRRRPVGGNEAERELFLFNAGFARGAAWMNAKLLKLLPDPGPEIAANDLVKALRAYRAWHTALGDGTPIEKCAQLLGEANRLTTDAFRNAGLR